MKDCTSQLRQNLFQILALLLLALSPLKILNPFSDNKRSFRPFWHRNESTFTEVFVRDKYVYKMINIARLEPGLNKHVLFYGVFR